MGRSLLLKRAGLFDNPGEIPDEGGRGPECVTPGLPSYDCTLPFKPRNRRYSLRHSGRSHRVRVHKVRSTLRTPCTGSFCGYARICSIPAFPGVSLANACDGRCSTPRTPCTCSRGGYARISGAPASPLFRLDHRWASALCPLSPSCHHAL